MQSKIIALALLTATSSAMAAETVPENARVPDVKLQIGTAPSRLQCAGSVLANPAVALSDATGGNVRMGRGGLQCNPLTPPAIPNP